MSARQRQPERVVARPLSIPDWTGTLSRTNTITGHLICSSTGWRMRLTGTADGSETIHLTAQFDSPVMSDDAAPWSDEADLAKPHELQTGGYNCFWTGTIKRQGAVWSGLIADRYGGRLTVTGKPQGSDVMSLRAVSEVAERR